MTLQELTACQKLARVGSLLIPKHALDKQADIAWFGSCTVSYIDMLLAEIGVKSRLPSQVDHTLLWVAGSSSCPASGLPREPKYAACPAAKILDTPPARAATGESAKTPDRLSQREMSRKKHKSIRSKVVDRESFNASQRKFAPWSASSTNTIVIGARSIRVSDRNCREKYGNLLDGQFH